MTPICQFCHLRRRGEVLLAFSDADGGPATFAICTGCFMLVAREALASVGNAKLATLAEQVVTESARRTGVPRIKLMPWESEVVVADAVIADVLALRNPETDGLVERAVEAGVGRG